MKCGREPLGSRVNELGVCPAAREWRVDGIHGGENAGRICWIVAGTMCEGQIQGTFALKHKNCENCEFYQIVKKEEGEKFVPLKVLLERLKRR